MGRDIRYSELRSLLLILVFITFFVLLGPILQSILILFPVLLDIRGSSGILFALGHSGSFGTRIYFDTLRDVVMSAKHRDSCDLASHS